MPPENKRIAIFTERIYPFYTGGSEKVLYDYAKILSQIYDVTVFTSFDKGRSKQMLGNVKFVYVSRKMKNSNKKGNHSIKGILSFSISAFLHRQKIQNFDSVILDSIHYFYPLPLLRFLKRQNGKIVTIFHEAWYKYRMSDAVSPLLSYFMGICIRRLIHYSDTVISISDPTTESLINNYNVRKDRVITIPLGIDYDKIANKYPIKDITDRQYDLVFVGRFATIKRISDIIDAVLILNKKGKKLEVALIGDGPQRRMLEQRIEELGLSKSFHLFGVLDENKKYSIMGNSKIFVLPSEREGFSLSTLEAMALGCIPIVSKPKFDEVFGVSHFVKNGENGMYYSVGNVDELAQTIISCLSNLETSKLMSFKAAETSKFYTTGEMASKIHDTFEQMTS
jgi:glycosyltransferase involved in cell wall biosynthesis